MLTSDQDAGLVTRLRAGERSAYETLVRRFGGLMLAVARRLLRNEDDARDAVQEAFLAAFRSIDRFEGHAQLGTWLHRIVVNAALMKIRAQRRVPSVAGSIEEMLPAFEADGHRLNPRPAWDAAADALIEQRETREMIRRKVDTLPEPYRTVLLLRDIEEIDTDQTASLLEISRSAVKTRLHRARMALRKLLEEELS